MMHRSRRHQITPVTASWRDTDYPDAYAAAGVILTQHTWCACNGWQVGGLTLLNDATGPDGAQEYAVIRDGREIESLTCSWMEPDRLAALLRTLDSEPVASDFGSRTVLPHQPGACFHCA